MYWYLYIRKISCGEKMAKSCNQWKYNVFSKLASNLNLHFLKNINEEVWLILNSYIVKELTFASFRSASPLAQLYGTSVMEHHHFDHCIMILHSSVRSGNFMFPIMISSLLIVFFPRYIMFQDKFNKTFPTIFENFFITAIIVSFEKLQC